MIWWLKILQTRFTMADISVATLTPKEVKKFDGAAGGINPNGENGIAVKFMTIVVFL